MKAAYISDRKETGKLFNEQWHAESKLVHEQQQQQQHAANRMKKPLTKEQVMVLNIE